MAALGRYPAVSFALLFGSRAGTTARPDSDWDVAIHLDPGLDERRRFEIRRQLSGELAGAARVDVVVLNDVPPLHTWSKGGGMEAATNLNSCVAESQRSTRGRARLENARTR